jgi:hypothetical protein
MSSFSCGVIIEAGDLSVKLLTAVQTESRSFQEVNTLSKLGTCTSRDLLLFALELSEAFEARDVDRMLFNIGIAGFILLSPSWA